MNRHTHKESRRSSTIEKSVDELKAVCGLDCEECQFYNEQCSGCRKERGRMFWGRCPIFFCCVHERGLKVCADCNDFLCQKFLNQITNSIGL